MLSLQSPSPLLHVYAVDPLVSPQVKNLGLT